MKPRELLGLQAQTVAHGGAVDEMDGDSNVILWEALLVLSVPLAQANWSWR